MSTRVLPASPNWYCSRVVDSNSHGTLVFGARHEVYIFDAGHLPLNFSGVFTGHTQKVTSVGLCGSDRERELCCSAAEDGRVKLWRVDTRELLAEHAIHCSKVTAVCWCAGTADLIVTGDDGGTIGVWQHEDNRQSGHRPEKGAIQVMAASPTEAAVVAVGYKMGQILLVDVRRGAAVLTRLRGHDEEIHALCWCPIPGEAFKPSREPSQDITDLETFGVEDSWRKKPPPVSVETSTGDFGQDGWLLASGSKDRTVRLWSTSKGRQLLVLKMPHPARRGGGGGEDGGGVKGRLWLALYWLKHEPGQIVSASQTGDLLLWDITKTGKDKCQPLHAPGRGHSRMVFSICPVGRENTSLLCTVSMDRMVLFWDLRLKCQVASIPSLGGFCYTLKVSPFDPGRLALGVGDTMIRLWNLNSPSDVCDIVTLWQGIKSKVTALCWHPKKEGVLAYGTDDGRVGIHDTLSKKPPHISTTYHKRTVYVVAWGPPSADKETGGSPGYSLYSCGDGVILEHCPTHLDTEAHNVSRMIQEANPAYRTQTKVPTQSEISWCPDYNYVAVGNDDGTVEIYRAPNFTLVATVQVLHKLINCIAWHPHVTMETPNGSRYKHCIAIGGNESSVCVVDLSKIYGEGEDVEVLQLVECQRRFEGHGGRITALAWSPHEDGMLASASYDGKALVWSLGSGDVLACYRGHLQKLLTLQWSGLDPGEVITGGDDFSVHRWRMAEHPVQPGTLDLEGSKKDRKRKKKAAVAASSRKLEAPVTMATEDGVGGDDDCDIAALLEAKKQELLQTQAAENSMQQTAEEDITAAVQRVKEPAATTETAVPDGVPDSKGDNKAKPHKHEYSSPLSREKKRKAKSMFPECNRRDNMRGRSYVLQDIETLATLIYESDGSTRELGEDLAHLGLFLDRRAVYACLKLEGEYHRNNDNMDYFYQLEIWKGNINAVLRVARQRDELSDWLVAMAPMASYDTWTSVCEDYALQLEGDGQYHKAATYFLACHKVYEAIKLFKRHKLFKEAIALAKVRLSPLDPALEELYTLWAQQLTKDGNYEQAAKCHLAMRQVQDAAKLLARRCNDQSSSLRTAAHISLTAGERQQGVMHTHRLVQQCLLRNAWAEAYTNVGQKKELQVFLATSSLHEMLTAQLTKMKLLTVDDDLFTKWQTGDKKNKTPLPDFILDPGDVDSLSPWQLRLVEGHTFPHYVLRTWYSQLGVAMDTGNLEDMYKTLCLLHAGRQSQVDLPQVLIQASTELTLSMLSLMMSETPTAMSHLLQAVGSLHETGHVHVMQGLLQLFLPQGPKYILKLQQEVTAMRVMISMDTHSHVDGASKVHTLRRYLSDLKDETTVNTASMRCRELDCLRAYYYVAILHFLKESCEDDVCGGAVPQLVDAADSTKVSVSGIHFIKESKDGRNELVAKLSGKDTKTGSVAVPVPGADTKEGNDRSENGDKRNDTGIEKADGVNGNGTSCDRTPSVENSENPNGGTSSLVSLKQQVEEKDASESFCSEKAKAFSEQTLSDASLSTPNGDNQDKADSPNGKCSDTEKDICDLVGDMKVCSEDTSAQTSGETAVRSETDTRATSTAATESLASQSVPSSVTSPTNLDSSPVTSQTIPNPSSATSETNPNPTATSQAISNPSSLTSQTIPNPSSVTSQGQSSTPTSPVLNVSRYSISTSQLYQISQGLLWDLQAKRFALTETLGYIHKAISQLLLSKNPKPSDSLTAIDTAVGSDQRPQGEALSMDDSGDRAASDSRITDTIGQQKNSPSDGDKTAESAKQELEGAVGFASGSSGESSELSGQSSVLESHPECGHHMPDWHGDGHICHAALEHHFDHMLTAHTPHTDMSSANIHGETEEHISKKLHLNSEFKCNFFEMCSSCELLQKSRKILFEDEPHFSVRPDVGGLRDMTNVTNPAKYINVPDEWYSMPVDLKYFKPYITMATLKDEQEYVMSELKRGPDSTQSPFPSPLESIKPLLEASLVSARVSGVERKEYAQKVVSWALNFAVTSQQKHTFVNLLQTHMDT